MQGPSLSPRSACTTPPSTREWSPGTPQLAWIAQDHAAWTAALAMGGVAWDTALSLFRAAGNHERTRRRWD